VDKKGLILQGGTGSFPTTCYDNFYENPDYIREYALTLEYSNDGGYFTGFRTDCLSNINEEFHYKSAKKILSMFGNFDLLEVNWSCRSYFHKNWSYSTDPNSILNEGWVHTDGDCTLAAVVYLDPNPNIDAGTSTYRIKDEYLEDGEFKYDEHPDYPDEKMLKIRRDATRTLDSCNINTGKEYAICLRNNNKHFEKTLEVKNSYNRVIIYDGNKFHGQTSIYKDNEDIRLTQVFFFYEIMAPFINIPKWRCEVDGI
tara:strand:- start:365 stop:1132 length:768 start_codon:yes stop_codon:yes gene_type:complete